jgi:hypothetical protein
MKRKGQDVSNEVNELRRLLMDQSINSNEMSSIIRNEIVGEEANG